MDPSSSMSLPPALHLAMAALLGASFMAISAFYIHRRTVDHVLHRLVEIRRAPPSASEEDGADDDDERSGFGPDGGETDTDTDVRNLSRSVDENLNLLRSYRISSSMPNVASLADWFREDPRNRASSLDNFQSVPLGLPSATNGENAHISCSYKRIASVGRIKTPRSPGRNTFESVEDSDEEGTQFGDDSRIPFYPVTRDGPNSSICNLPAIPFRVDDSNTAKNQICGEVSKEAKRGADVNEGGIANSTSVAGNDLLFVNNVLQARGTTLEPANIEEEEVCKMIRECLDLRKKYVYKENIVPWKTEPVATNSDPFHFEPVEATTHHFRMEDGVVHVFASKTDPEELFPVASSTAFFTDMHYILKVMSIGNVRSACYHRLRFLEEKFRLHLLLNADREFLAQKGAPHRDFYNIRKVDTHIHHSACMNQKHLVRFIKSKLRKEPDEVVIFRDGKYMTLKEVFESLDLTGYDLNVDLLDVHADKSTFHRFDKFNLKYNPCGQSRLREIFLKQDNLIQGRFLAEVTKQVLSDLEASKYQMAEYRISVYGRKMSEWDQLASWFVNNALYSKNAVWLIQLPRLYNVYKNMGIVNSFQNILDNVFIPLFEATVDPNSHPQLHLFLMQVVGFDLVDDESKPERRPTKHMPTPAEWTNEFNPAYSYYIYYCYANLYTLNKLRESKGMTTIKLRPHCGEAGDSDHLAAGFLLCHNISHGINLRKTPVLQYLYYLAQVGLAMSPLSNNSLFLDYHRNPLPMFFQRGLNVSLSTDDPLQIHLTKEPLLEEYSVAAKVWKLSSCDLCEIARNSVYQSGFSHPAKLHWLGDKYFLSGSEGNDIHKTNVPDLRVSFRYETWKEEMQYIYAGQANFPEDVDP
ncbi:probable AMP deaminase isoform X2 [Lotus japonicus]|uniref:probable AMP deaminase isoform X2 n=1 Tax=Lotus japonicus TaxID=34305 RepID=UPI002584CE9B|nr:probable AMP deaminase isoform X2 [Lotus japonicus]